MAITESQSRVINHETGNILVSASAGSGKTFVMIERLIRLILQGKTKVKRILCVTFTDKAAYEMKEKLKKALVKKIEEGEDLVEQLLDVETADVCTIDSFCSRLVRKYFFKAEVSPDFKVCDEKVAEVLKNQSIDKTFNKLYEDKPDWFLTLLGRHNEYRLDKAFKKLIIDMFDFMQSEADSKEFTKKCLSFYDKEFDLIVREYKKYVDIQLKLLILDCEQKLMDIKGLDFSTAEDILSRQISILNQMRNAKLYDLEEFRNYKISLAFGHVEGEKKELAKKQITNFAEKIKKTISRLLGCITTYDEDKLKALENKKHLEHLFKVVELFEENYTQLKRQENYLDFSDLEHFALKVLRDAQTAEGIRGEYDYVFADEYQDVNGVQEELFSRLSKDNLFVVGDVKQSIYGFRGCKPEIFEEKEAYMQKTNQETVRLNENFRSAKAVLDMANEIFSFSMTKEIYGTSYKDTAMLKEGGVYEKEHQGRAKLHLLDKQVEVKRAVEEKIYNILEAKEQIKNTEISNQAILIHDIIKGELGSKFYLPRNNAPKGQPKDEERFVSYKDIVILCKTKNSEYIIELVKELIKIGIPVQSEVADNVINYPEVDLLVKLLELIDCKQNDIPLISVMKSPIGSFSEEELLDISLLFKDNAEVDKKKRTFTMAYNYALANADEPLKSKLAEFNKKIDELRFLSNFMGAGKILEKAICDSNFESYLIVQGDYQEKLSRVNFFIEVAQKEKIYTIHEYLELIRNSEDTFKMGVAVSENSIRAMTIHASKGLEFPVVIVCGLEKGKNKKKMSDTVLKDFEFGFALHDYNDEDRQKSDNIFRGLFVEKMRIESIKEDLRVFYVATTRASYSMHLTIENSEDKRRTVFAGAENYGDYIPRDLSEEFVEVVDVWAMRERFNSRQTERVFVAKNQENLSPEKQQVVEKIRNNLNNKYAFIVDTKLPLKCSVTKMIKRDENEDGVYRILTFESTGIERGVTAHKILENLDFESAVNGNFMSQVNEMIEKGKVERQKVEQLDLERIEGAIKIFAKDFKGKRLYREQPFISQIDGEDIFGVKSEKVLLQGIIDLLVIDDEGATIIDYKYSSLDKDKLKDKYSKQLELYAKAVETVLKIKVRKKTLVNILSGECVLV